MLEVWIVRHGRTALNQRGLLQGRGSDAPLDAEGIAQAREAGTWLQEGGIFFDEVLSSPLVRAVQTASLVSGRSEDEIERDDLLLEMDYGPWEGYELSAHAPAIESFFADFAHNPAPKGMEQLSQVKQRAADFLASLAHKEGRILVSTHAILLKGLLEVLDPSAQGSWWSRYVGNCWIYRARADAQALDSGSLGVAELVYDGAGHTEA